jgi:hypothetical protein
MTTNEARAALREKVADAIADGWDREGSILDAADAAIDVVLEEAAKLFDPPDECDCSVCQDRREQAAAIRGLKGDVIHNPPNEPG